MFLSVFVQNVVNLVQNFAKMYHFFNEFVELLAGVMFGCVQWDLL